MSPSRRRATGAVRALASRALARALRTTTGHAHYPGGAMGTFGRQFGSRKDRRALPGRRDGDIAPKGNPRAEWTRARAVRGLAARALGGASRETRQPIIAPYRNGTRACAQWICAWPPGLPAPWRLATLCTKQITRAVFRSGVDCRHDGRIRKKSLLFFLSGENHYSQYFQAELKTWDH